MKTKLLLSFVFFLLISIVGAGFANWADVVEDSSLTGNQHLKNYSTTGPLKFMPIPKFGEAIFFNNTDKGDTISFKNDNGTSEWGVNGNRTYEMWLWTNNSNDDIQPRAFTIGSGGDDYQIRMNEIPGLGGTTTFGNLTLVVQPIAGANISITTLTLVNDSTWHHVAFTIFNSSVPIGTNASRNIAYVRFYLDGVLVEERKPIQVDSTTDEIDIGKSPTSGTKSWYGGLDEIRISNITRYESNFVVPDSAFIADDKTIALWRMGNGTEAFLIPRTSVMFFTGQFLNFTGSIKIETANQFWVNITNATIANVEITPPNGTAINVSMSTTLAISNMSVSILPTNSGTYNITRVFARNGTSGDTKKFWNETKFSGLTWTITEDLAFSGTFLNLSAVLKSSPNQFWFFNRNATSGWFEVTAPNASIYNFSMTQSSGTDNFTKQMTFSTNGFYNITKLFAKNSFSSNYNTTKVAGLRWEVSNSTNIFVCNEAGADQHVAVNFTFKAELNRSDLNISKFEASFITQDLTNATGQINITVTRENVKHVAICIQPDTHDLQTNATIKYAKDGYNFRNWHYVNENLTAEQQNTTLYLLNAADATAITIQVTDSLDAAIEGAVTEVQRFYIGNNTFTIIGMIKAGNDGKDLIYLQKNEGDYRFRVLVDNVQKLLTKEAKVTSTSLILKVFETALADLIRNLGAITSSITYNNDTNIVTFTFNDPNEIIQSACVEATRHNQSGRFFFGPSCTNTSFGTSIALFSGNGSGSQLIIGAGYVIIGKLKYTVDPSAFSEGKNSNVAVWGVFGAFVLFFVLLAAVMTQVHNPVAMLAMFMVALIGAFFLGIYSMPWGVLVGLIAAIVIIITQLRS